MAFIVSPTDQDLCNALGGISDLLPESWGADCLVDVLTKEGNNLVVAFQRKHIPEDFLASVKDGRLSREILQLQQADIRVLIIEGNFRYDSYGALWISRRPTGWYRERIENMLLSIQVAHNIAVERTKDIEDTANRIKQITKWASESDHVSLVKRKGPAMLDWMQKQDKVSYYYQGMESVGYKLSRALSEMFEPGDLYEATVEEIMAVPKIGKGKAEKIFEFIHRRRNATEMLARCTKEETIAIGAPKAPKARKTKAHKAGLGKDGYREDEIRNEN